MLIYEELNPRERLGLLFMDEVPDRIPLNPFITTYAAKIAGLDIKTFLTDGLALGKAQVAAFEKYGYDCVTLTLDTPVFAEVMGSVVEMNKEGRVTLKKPAIKERNEINKLKEISSRNIGRLEVFFEAIQYCYDSIGDVVPINFAVMGPFSLAAQLRGTGVFLKDLVEAPDFANELLDIATENMVRILDMIMLLGAYPFISDPLASCSVISPQMYREFAAPREKVLIDYIHRNGPDAMLHICGDTEPILEDIADTGTMMFSFEKVDINVVRRRIGNRVRLVGNIDPEEIMHLGSPQQVKETVRICIEKGKKSPKGFILATGCEIPYDTPIENLEAFMAAGKEYGLLWDWVREASIL